MEKLEFPYTFQELTEEEKAVSEIYGVFDLVKVLPVGYSTTRRIIKYGPELYNFKPRPDDVWLIGFPRSGTTLTQEILYLLGTNFNYKKAASKIMDDRFPFFEDVLMISDDVEEKFEEFRKKNKVPETPEELAMVPHYKQLELTKEKRFIKSHQGFPFLHPQLLEVGCKVVFIARNVKDALVSLHYFPLGYEIRKDLGIYTTWKNMKMKLGLGGDWIDLLKQAWKRRNSKNLLILFYEEVNKDKRGAILKMAEFMGKKITKEQLQTLLDHVDIKKFKENKSVNNDHLVDSGLYVKNKESSFIRSGKTGGWRENFSKEMNEEINQWFLDELKDIPDFEIPKCWREAMDL